MQLKTNERSMEFARARAAALRNRIKPSVWSGLGYPALRNVGQPMLAKDAFQFCLAGRYYWEAIEGPVGAVGR